MVLEKFVPPQFIKAKLDLHKLFRLTGKNWSYGANGSICLYHILQALNCRGKILLPVFTCPRILTPVKKSGLEPVFYDLDPEDLNPSLKSIKYLAKKSKAKSLLSVSLFGNPADLINIEEFARNENILLIDDNAQSFGGKIDERWLGTFGDGGFFAFSPGKATAGHMGGFFWTKNSYKVKYKNHNFIHWLKWLDFAFNRMNIYDRQNKILRKIINLLASKSYELFDLTEDGISEFEKKVLGGIMNSIIDGDFKFRNYYNNIFINEFSNNPYFRPVKALRGNTHNHKLVLIANSKEIAKNLISYLGSNGFYCSNSYVPLCDDISGMEGMKTIEGKVIEIPIENSADKMNYLFSRLRNF